MRMRSSFRLFFLGVSMCWACETSEPTEPSGLSRSKGQAQENQPESAVMRVAEQVPETWLLQSSPYAWSGGKGIVRKDISQDVFEREARDTGRWLGEVIQARELWPRRPDGCMARIGALGCTELTALSGIGKHGDDGMMVSWVKNGYRFEAIDSRLLSVAVLENPAGVSDETPVELLKKISGYDVNCANYKKEWDKMKVMERHVIDKTREYGRIDPACESTSWFNEPIEYYREWGKMLYVFEKLQKPPENKDRSIDFQLCCGGAPVYDKRPWTRFENSNRAEMARDYFIDWLQNRTPAWAVKEWTSSLYRLWFNGNVGNCGILGPNCRSNATQKKTRE